MSNQEKWRDIKGFPNHKISNLGRLKSFGVKKEGVIIKGFLDKDGYRRHFMRYKNISKNKLAHRLVAEAFIPNPENKPQVNHKDGNKLNNKVDNLEWCSSQENIAHACETGLRKNKGEHNVKAKLKAYEVDQIKHALSMGVAPKNLAKEYGVTRTTIYDIKNKKTWVGYNENLNIKRLSDNAILPKRANEFDSGLDLYASEDVTVKAGKTLIIPTDIAIELPIGYEAQVRPRSGMSVKTKLRVVLGTIDRTYHDRIGIIADNIGTQPYEVKKGDRVAQLVIAPVVYPAAQEVKEFSYESDRGGFGSTGK